MSKIKMQAPLSAIVFTANNSVKVDNAYAIEFNNAGTESILVNGRTVTAGNPWSIGGNENVAISDSVFFVVFDSSDTAPRCEITIYKY